MSKVVFISGLQPYSHYSRYLCECLAKKVKDFIVYADKDPRNESITGCGQVKLVWDKNWKYIFQILQQVYKDKPAIVHLQHEFNMFGGMFTSLLFPFLVIYLRLIGIKVITTIHGVTPLKIINDDFVQMFKGSSTWIRPYMLKIAFFVIYYLVTFFSHKVIVHTDYLKHLLVSDYFATGKKIEVVLMGVPDIYENPLTVRKPYFLYFGYLVKRKGLEFVVDGYEKFLRENPQTAYYLVFAGGTIKGQEFAAEDLKSYVKKKNLEDKVLFPGFLEAGDIRKYMTEATIVLVPASVSIAASGPLSHALSFGRSVIASNVDNLNTEIIDGIDGLLVDNAHWDAAFHRIANVEGLLEKLEEGARTKAQSRNWKNVAVLHSKYYEELV